MKIRKIRANPGSAAAKIFALYEAEKTSFQVINAARFNALEGAIKATNDLGRLPLWQEYQNVENYGRPIDANTKRKMGDVRTKAEYCQFYAWLVAKMQPDAVLEFGAAFGASGMYWLAGMDLAKRGKLFSFEPNEIWHPIAKGNFDRVSDRHLLTLGTFEDNLDVIDTPPGIALIDAIHTREFVDRQFEMVRRVAASGALVLFDDINFSDDMRDCWAAVAARDEWTSVWQLSGRVGVVELP